MSRELKPVFLDVAIDDSSDDNNSKTRKSKFIATFEQEQLLQENIELQRANSHQVLHH
jgi:hypothetical protein